MVLHCLRGTSHCTGSGRLRSGPLGPQMPAQQLPGGSRGSSAGESIVRGHLNEAAGTGSARSSSRPAPAAAGRRRGLDDREDRLDPSPGRARRSGDVDHRGVVIRAPRSRRGDVDAAGVIRSVRRSARKGRSVVGWTMSPRVDSPGRARVRSWPVVVVRERRALEVDHAVLAGRSSRRPRPCVQRAD